MNLYKELATLRCFTHNNMVQLTGSESAAIWHIKSYLQKGAAIWHIKSYLQKGYIERVRCDLYAVISMETGDGFAGVPPDWEYGSRFARGA